MRTFAWLLLAAPLVHAQSILVEESRPSRPVVLGHHRVEAKIQDRVSAVTVEQVFHNTTRRRLEGTYLFPLPRGASVSDFAMTMGGRMVKGEILDAERARAIYRSIVQRRRDPGLLEYVGRGLFRARVFPIEPNGAVKIRLRYQQLLPETAGTVELRYPLKSREQLASALVDLHFESSVDLKTIYSPSHAVEVKRDGERKARVTWEGGGRRERNLLVYFGRSEADVGFSVLSHKPVADEGTFLAIFAPRVKAEPGYVLPKDVIYVIDRSGSMMGKKMTQAKEALRYGIGLLRPEDRFNIVSFASDWRHFRPRLVTATAEAKRAAETWIDRMQATGGTALEAALATALRQASRLRLSMVVLITDGRPTMGVTEPRMILEQVKRANAARARVFTFGVGDDLDVHLLDRIAEATRGKRDYVARHEEIGTVTGRFFRKIDAPLLARLRIELGEGVSQVYPRNATDLYAGEQIVLMGRYEKPGWRTVRISGWRGPEEVVYEYRAELAKDERSPFLPRLWAHRKVAFLLDEIRLHGSHRELIDEVISLGRRYSFVTPYTAGLVLEADSRPLLFASSGPRGGPPPGLRAPADPETPPPAPVGPAGPSTPAEPADLSKYLRKAKERAVVRNVGAVRAAEDKTFRLDRKGRWIDGAWDGKVRPMKIEAFSKAYFDLVDKDDRIAKYLAVGERVLFVFEGKVYEVVPAKRN